MLPCVWRRLQCRPCGQRLQRRQDVWWLRPSTYAECFCLHVFCILHSWTFALSLDRRLSQDILRTALLSDGKEKNHQAVVAQAVVVQELLWQSERAGWTTPNVVTGPIALREEKTSPKTNCGRSPSPTLQESDLAEDSAQHRWSGADSPISLEPRSPETMDDECSHASTGSSNREGHIVMTPVNIGREDSPE